MKQPKSVLFLGLIDRQEITKVDGRIFGGIFTKNEISQETIQNFSQICSIQKDDIVAILDAFRNISTG